MRQHWPLPKLWRRKTAQRAVSPTAVFRSPSRFSGEAYTDCYALVLLLIKIYLLFVFILNPFFNLEIILNIFLKK